MTRHVHGSILYVVVALWSRLLREEGFAKKVKVEVKVLQTLPLQEKARVLADAGYIIQAPV